jgi:hypothetical protein
MAKGANNLLETYVTQPRNGIQHDAHDNGLLKYRLWCCWMDAGYNRYVGDFAAVEAIQVIRTRARSTDAVLQCLELDIIARFAAVKRFQTVIRRVLEDIEGISDLEIAVHAMVLHDLSNVARAAAMVLQTHFLIHFGKAGHECHVVNFHRIVDDLENWFVLVGPQMLSNGRCGSREMVAGVRHGQFLCQLGVLYPCCEVDHLLAIQVYDSEMFALLHFESETMTGLYEVCLRPQLVLCASRRISIVWKYHDFCWLF